MGGFGGCGTDLPSTAGAVDCANGGEAGLGRRWES